MKRVPTLLWIVISLWLFPFSFTMALGFVFSLTLPQALSSNKEHPWSYTQLVQEADHGGVRSIDIMVSSASAVDSHGTTHYIQLSSGDHRDLIKQLQSDHVNMTIEPKPIPILWFAAVLFGFLLVPLVIWGSLALLLVRGQTAQVRVPRLLLWAPFLWVLLILILVSAVVVLLPPAPLKNTGPTWSYTQLLKEADHGMVRSIDVTGSSASAVDTHGISHYVQLPNGDHQDLIQQLQSDHVNMTIEPEPIPWVGIAVSSFFLIPLVIWACLVLLWVSRHLADRSDPVQPADRGSPM
jgi:hypothetical protein